MLVRRGYKFELVLTPEQEKTLTQWLGTCRLLWNLALEQREIKFNQFQSQTSFGEQSAELKELKAAFPFFAGVPHHCLQQKLKDLQAAYDRFFAGLGSYPQRKRKGRCRDSIRYPDPKQFEIVQTTKMRTRSDSKVITKGFGIADLPKIGALRFRQSRVIGGAIKNATIGKDSGKWHISFSVEEELPVAQACDRSVGIDRGVNQMGMTSTGQVLEVNVARFKSIEARIARKQRLLTKKKKSSSNWKKAQQEVARLHSKITNIRHDQIHKITTAIAKNQGFVAIEELKIKNMTASARGTIDEPGSMVRQKSGLNKSILRQGWGYFSDWLEYKVAWRQGELIKVPPSYTSQMCNKCDHVAADSRSGIAFECIVCGHTDHADINAAKNILKVGLDMARAWNENSKKPVEKQRKQLRRIRNPKARKSPSPAA